MAETTKYVVGFLFANNERQVVLLRKTRPAWQAGKLNGLGGHVEPGESFNAAMVREFEEEAGLAVSWTHFATIEGAGWIMGCYRASSPVDDLAVLLPKINDVGESIEVRWCEHVSNGTHDTIPNLRWLVPMAHPNSEHDWPYHIVERRGGRDVEATTKPGFVTQAVITPNSRAPDAETAEGEET